MKRFNISKLLLASAFLTAPAAAQDFDSLPSVKDIVSQAKAAEVSAPLPALPPDTRAAKEWTIMVFMNGKNNLSDYVIKDMNEMEKYGPSENINLVTQAARLKYTPSAYPSGGGGYYDPIGGPTVPHPGWPDPVWPGFQPMMLQNPTRGASAGGLNSDWPGLRTMILPATSDASTDWTGVRRYLVTADGDKAALSSTLLADMGVVDMGDYKQLVEFGKWAKKNYPARKYMLIVWNHGDGWKTKSFGRPSTFKGISYDDETGNGITTVQLGAAVREMGGVDIYASDACLMQMAEVAYELKDGAKITVGSEETEPGDGWAYDYFLSRVHANKANLTPEVMAAAAVQGYKAFYKEKGISATQSALKTSSMAGFRSVMDQWAALAMKEDKAMIKEALNASTSFSGVDSRDLIHFMELVHAKAASGALKAKTVTAMNYIYDHVILDNGVTGDNFAKAYGIGVYLPAYSYETPYGNLAWSKEGQWDEFMQWVTAK